MTEIFPRTDQISYLIGGLKVPKVKEKYVESVIERDQIDFQLANFVPLEEPRYDSKPADLKSVEARVRKLEATV